MNSFGQLPLKVVLGRIFSTSMNTQPTEYGKLVVETLSLSAAGYSLHVLAD
jgi:hypothetical protein